MSADLREVRRLVQGRLSNPRHIVVDDIENIAAAARAGVGIQRAFYTDEVAAEMLAGLGVEGCRVTREQVRETFPVEKASRVFALATTPGSTTLTSLAGESRDLVVLDGVRLAGNIGAVTRTGFALGCAGLVLVNTGLRSVYDRRLIRASRGLVFQLPTVLAGAAQFTDFCDRHDLPIVTTTAAVGFDISRLALIQDRIALVLGGERGGCSQEVRQASRARVSIAMRTGVDSLNVSVAAGIALHARACRNLAG